MNSSSRLPRPAVLWTINLGPPAVWLAAFLVRYALVPWCCANGNRSLLWAVSGASALLAVALFLLAWVCWQRSQSSDAAEELSAAPRRSRFLAHLGLMSGIFFGLAIIAQALPVFFIDPCLR